MGWVVNDTPRPLYPPERPSTQLYRRLGGPQRRSGRVRKISPPPEFDLRTVLPVASVGDDNTIKYINTIKAHFLVCNTFYAQSGLAFLHFFKFFPFSASPVPTVCTPNRYSIPHSYRRLHSLHRMSTALLLGNQQAFSGSDWLRVRSFVLDLQRGLSWVS